MTLPLHADCTFHMADMFRILDPKNFIVHRIVTELKAGP